MHVHILFLHNIYGGLPECQPVPKYQQSITYAGTLHHFKQKGISLIFFLKKKKKEMEEEESKKAIMNIFCANLCILNISLSVLFFFFSVTQVIASGTVVTCHCDCHSGVFSCSWIFQSSWYHLYILRKHAFICFIYESIRLQFWQLTIFVYFAASTVGECFCWLYSSCAWWALQTIIRGKCMAAPLGIKPLVISTEQMYLKSGWTV